MKNGAMDEKLKVVLFSGGRGTATITDALLKHPQIALTLIVNAYDDGLSTGALRRYVPGMLGPSDVRKNLSRMIPASDRSLNALRFLLEYRFPLKVGASEALDSLRAFVRKDHGLLLQDLVPSFSRLNLSHLEALGADCAAFLEYHAEQERRGVPFEFADCSLGNLIFTGCYLRTGRDFNRAIAVMSQVCEISGTLLNVTRGENLVLVGVKEDGSYLANEAQIVSKQNSSRLSEIFLLENYLQEDEVSSFANSKLGEVTAYLRSVAKTPEISDVAREALETADVIIYGPGTQHSSLFPSYLTRGVSEAIASNYGAEKIFIGNILKDHEIRNEDANTLSRKLLYYLNCKGDQSFSWKELVTTFFFHTTDRAFVATEDYVDFPTAGFAFPDANVALLDWESESGVHSGNRVLDELIGIINTRLQRVIKPVWNSVSIVVPAYNEAKTVRKVLHELSLLDLSTSGLAKEIVFVDGGSTDGTYELAEKESGVRCYRLEERLGRGAALRLGIEKATGNIIVFFPSDGEYSAQDLVPIVNSIARSEFQAVFGSRVIKCVNLNQQLLDIYGGDRLTCLISKYGGMALSVLSLLLYNRFVSDPLTSIKAFDARLLKSLGLCSQGVDLDTEIIAKLALRRIFLMEVPVQFFPRTKKDGKKTTVFDGIKAIAVLIRYRFFEGRRTDSAASENRPERKSAALPSPGSRQPPRGGAEPGLQA